MKRFFLYLLYPTTLLVSYLLGTYLGSFFTDEGKEALSNYSNFGFTDIAIGLGLHLAVLLSMIGFLYWVSRKGVWFQRIIILVVPLVFFFRIF